MIFAAQTAGLNVLRLFNDTAAIALAYGIYKQVGRLAVVYVQAVQTSHIPTFPTFCNFVLHLSYILAICPTVLHF